MALDVLDMVEVIEMMENYIERIRPPKEVRDKLDVNYRIENQSIILYDIRPRWDKKDQIQTSDFAKATYDKKNVVWKIYWLRARIKWDRYEPEPAVKQLSDFLRIVDEDKYHCFKG